jgi:hypothetical protein
MLMDKRTRPTNVQLTYFFNGPLTYLEREWYVKTVATKAPKRDAAEIMISSSVTINPDYDIIV